MDIANMMNPKDMIHTLIGSKPLVISLKIIRRSMKVYNMKCEDRAILLFLMPAKNP